MPAFQPYWGKPAVRNDREDRGNVGIIRSPVRASILPDRMYKPRPEVYALVTGHFKCVPKDVTFISSNRWDVMGAVSFGFHALWVNRAKMPDEYADHMPAQTIGDLSEFAQLTA